jgi:putative PIN family toxin of toxin-antitoxin system
LKIVFDTNVVIAGLVAEGLCHELIERHLPRHEAILSAVLWDELLAALRAKFRIEPQELPFLDLYRRHATWVEPERLAAPVSRDPTDDWVLATALAGKAGSIVTGDDDLPVLGSYRGVEILTPRLFLERYASAKRVEP